MAIPVEFFGLLISGLALAAAIASHAVLLRFAGWAFLKGLAASLVVGFGVVVVAHATLPMFGPFASGAGALLLVGDCLLLACGWFVFLNFVVCSESSIRVRLLREIIAAGGSIAEADLMAAYNERALVDMRLDRLVTGGQVVVADGRYRLTSRPLRAIGLLFRSLKRLILRRTSEFD